MKKNQWLRNKNGLIKVICGSLLAVVPAVCATTSRGANALTSVAIPVAQLNLSSSLISQVPSDGPGSPRESAPPLTDPVAPPLPEQQKPPVAKVVPVDGKVNVKLVNQTYTNITYQAVGDTKPRTLAGRSDVTLKDLKTPVNITFQRPDRGLLRVSPQSPEAGLLEVSLVEATNLSADSIAMTIQENGDVLLN